MIALTTAVLVEEAAPPEVSSLDPQAARPIAATTLRAATADAR
jgi:hypothetical protein